MYTQISKPSPTSSPAYPMMLMGKYCASKFKLHKRTSESLMHRHPRPYPGMDRRTLLLRRSNDDHQQANPVVTFYDINGQVIHMEPTYDFQWRRTSCLRTSRPCHPRNPDREDTRFSSMAESTTDPPSGGMSNLSIAKSFLEHPPFRCNWFRFPNLERFLLE